MAISGVTGAQSVIRPGVCTSSTKPASPYNGQMIYMTDTKQTAVWDGTVWLPTDLDYTTFTPTWNSGYTRGNGTTVAKYQRIGKTLFLWITETLGTTSAVTATPVFTLPIAIANTDVTEGTAVLEITGAGYSLGMCTALGSTQAEIWAVGSGGAYASIAAMSATIPFTWATGHKINISMSYQYLA
jgi:hypothetical protein